jgi:hypothetical protein
MRQQEIFAAQAEKIAGTAGFFWLMPYRMDANDRHGLCLQMTVGSPDCPSLDV